MTLGPAQGVVHCDIRPIRLGYLVRQGNRSDLRAAMLEACTRWGGIQELIIPVRRSGTVDPIWMSALTAFPVDYLCEVGEIPQRAKDKLTAAYQVETVTLGQVQSRFGIHPLAVYPPEDARSVNCVCARPDAPLESIAAMGAFRDPEDSFAWSTAGATIAAGPLPLQAAGLQLAGRTLIVATSHQCGETLIEGWPGGQIIIWLSKSSNVADLVLFWNFRALLPVRLDPAPICLIDPDTARDPAFRRILEPAVRAMPMKTTPPAVMYSRSITPAERAAIARAMGVPIHRGDQVTRHLGSSPIPADGSLSIAVRQYPLTGGRRQPGQRSSVLTLVEPRETIIRVPTPVRWGTVGGEIRARFSGPPQFKIPNSRSGARLFHDAAVVYEHAVEIQTAPGALFEFRLRVPDGGSILRAVLSERGAALALSDKGRLATGVRSITTDSRLFRNPQIVATIDALTTHRFEYELREARKQLPASGDAELEALVQRLHEVRQVTRQAEQVRSELARMGTAIGLGEVGDLLTQLVDAKLATRGLLVSCTVCGFPSFVPLAQVVIPMACPACGSPSGFVTDSRRHEPLIHYRLNALVDRASDQGVLLHLSAAALVLEVDPAAFVFPGVDIRLQGADAPSEVDLLYLMNGEIGFGEVKRSATQFSHERIDSDVRLASRLGGRIYLMACGESIAQQSLDHAVQVCRSNDLRLIVMEGADGSWQARA